MPRAIAFVALVLLACGKKQYAGEEAARVAPDAAEENAEMVLVKRTAVLHSAPREAARLGAVGRDDTYSDGIYAYRLLGRADGWAEIEMSGDDRFGRGGTCYATATSLPFVVRFFVRESELLPVLAREVEVKFADGTGARVSPGVGVFGRDGDRLIVGVDRWRVAIPVPADVIGTSYVARAPRDPERRRGQLSKADRIKPATEPAPPSRALGKASQVTIDGGRPVTRGSDYRHEDVSNVVETPAGTLASVGPACLGLTVLVDPTSLVKSPYWMSDPRADPGLLLASGTELTWPDGSPAGRSYDDERVHDDGVEGDRRCFHEYVGELTLRLCVAADRLQGGE